MSKKNPSLNHAAWQLFYQELQELLDSLGQGIPTLNRVKSLSELKHIWRSLWLMHQGALQIQATAIVQQTTPMLEILQPYLNQDVVSVSGDDQAQLQQLLAQLQAFDWADLDRWEQSVDSPVADFEDEMEADYQMRQVLLQKDIQAVLAQLQVHLTEEVAALVMAWLPKLELLIRWGEVLEWPEWVDLSQAIAQGLEAHPTAGASIATVGLKGLQSLHREALNTVETLARTTVAPSTPDLSSSNATAFAMAMESIDTTKMLLWQTQHYLFVLESDAIAETLIPKSNQILTGSSRTLQWQGQRIPLKTMHQLLAPCATDLPVPFQPEPAQVFPVLVIRLAGAMIALEVNMEQLLRLPALEVSPVVTVLSFYRGTALGRHQQTVHVVDVLALLSPVRAAQVLPFPTVGSSISDQVAEASLSVLIVDDSRTVRYILKQVFDEAGYTVLQAEDGLQAMDQLQQHPEVAIMVSDVEMPNLTGFELLSQCRRNMRWQDLPIVIVSYCNTDQHRQLALQFGADAYVAKPFDKSSLLQTIEALLPAR